MRLPWSVVAAHLGMIRVLSAEESLSHVTETAAGMGLIKKHERDQILNSWRRDTRMGEKRHRKTTLDDLLAPGLPFVEVKRG